MDENAAAAAALFIRDDDDENARDEFSASYFFKNQNKTQDKLNGIPMLKRPTSSLRDITNATRPHNVSDKSNKISAVVRNFDQRTKLKPSQKRDSSQNTESAEFAVKRKRKDGIVDNTENCQMIQAIRIRDGDDTVNYFRPPKRDMTAAQLPALDESAGPMSMEFHEQDDDRSTAYNISQAFRTPASGYNNKYRNYIVVAEPTGKSQIVKVDEHSSLWKTMMDSSKIERRVLLTSPRKWCSPREQFVITSNNQYRSQCLIRSYFSLHGRAGSFFSECAAVKDCISLLVRKYGNVSSLVTETTNTSHFHELFLEKLLCNEPADFMPVSPKLTGSILGGFVNDLFELSNHKYVPNEVIHIAVDLIYQYLSRVHDVPLIDIRWITMGAVWLAAKYEGAQILNVIKDLAGCSLMHLRKAELRLLMVVDFNVTKPHAINFRNRFLIIEQSNSTILHLSSFILDMSLHCYTLMLLPASRRAAAAMWLARLIDTFEGVRFNDELWCNAVSARAKMDSVWPTQFEKLTGYCHGDISLLALKMHVIIIAFISGGEPQYPSVSACHDKYSHFNYGELTSSYERFTARTVFYASRLYCQLHGLVLDTWMEKNEFETLWRNFAENKVVQLRHCGGGNSCPAELMPRSIVAAMPTPPDSAASPRPSRPDSAAVATTRHTGYKLQKLDSGYSTTSCNTLGGL